MAFGTWAGLGPSESQLLSRIAKRAGGWLEGDLRRAATEEVRVAVGMALMRKVWLLLERKKIGHLKPLPVGWAPVKGLVRY